MRTGGTLALAVLALGFGLSSLYLYWQLEAERSRARAAPPTAAVDCPQAAPSPPSAASMPQQLLPPAQAATSLSAATSGVLRAPGPFTPPPFSDEQRDFFTRKRYGAVFRELGLSEDDIAALVPLLSEQDLRVSKPIPKSRLAADGSVLPDPDSAKQSASDRAEIAALIGSERAAKLEELRKTLPARNRMRGLRLQLEDTSEPLTEKQLAQLMAATANKTYATLPLRVEGESPEQSRKRFEEWQDESARQVHEDAAAVLTPRQLKIVDEEAAMQKHLRLSGMRQNSSSPQGAAGAAAH